MHTEARAPNQGFSGEKAKAPRRTQADERTSGELRQANTGVSGGVQVNASCGRTGALSSRGHRHGQDLKL